MSVLRFISLTLLFTLALQFSLDPTRKFIIDDYGRPTVLHGVNVVMKVPPYQPDTEKFDPAHSLSDEDIKYMKGLGFNFVRLGVLWEAVEKVEGVYDMEYLKNMTKIINKLGENGIYTMIDTHQDLFSKKFCGNGVPYFYVDKLGVKTTCSSSITGYLLGLVGVCKPMSKFDLEYDERGVPTRETCNKVNWVDYHFTSEVTSAYYNFFKNVNGVQDKYIEFWKVLANTFKGNKYIVGYDIWNEPFPGGLWDDLTLIIPGKGDNKQLLPLYKRLDRELRKIDPDYILIFENMPFPDWLPLFGGLILGKFDKTPGEPDSNQVYNVHSYCCNSDANACPSGEPSLEWAKGKCTSYHAKKVEKNVKDAENLKIPLMISEFGACNDGENCLYEMWGVVKPSEPHFVSWAYWLFKPLDDPYKKENGKQGNNGIYFYDDGTIQPVKERALSRGYIQYFQGKPISFNYTNEETNFEFVYELDTEITKPTRFYINKSFFYSNGYNIKVVDENEKDIPCLVEEVEDNYFEITKLDSSLNGKKVKVIVTAN